jgi:hypothetical protein
MVAWHKGNKTVYGNVFRPVARETGKGAFSKKAVAYNKKCMVKKMRCGRLQH